VFLFLDDSSVRGIARNGLHAIPAATRGFVHLAPANFLAIGCLEYEIPATVFRLADFEALGIPSVLANRLDPVAASCTRLLALAREDNLAIGSHQSEKELTVLTLEYNKFSCHLALPLHG